MKYDFQTANHIDDYLAAIAGVDEFFVKDEGGIKVINYMFNTPETFPNPLGLEGMARRAAILRRDCRGLKFDAKTGLIIAKPYHKFFNANQNQESQVSEIEWSRPHLILEKLDGCLPSYSLIDFCDGTQHKISDVVKNKMTGPVWGMSDGKIVPTNITNWSKKGLSTDWLTFLVNDQTLSNKIRTVACTYNHEVMTQEGWKEASYITTADSLIKSSEVFDKIQKSMILGSLLGDMSIWYECGAFVLQYGHKLSHEYIQLKANILSPYYTSLYSKTSGYGPPQILATTRSAEAIREIVSLTYTGNKTVSEEWLNLLDDMAWAFWYMDDGSMSKGQISQRPRALLHIEGFFDEKSIENIGKYFQRMDIPAVRQICKNAKYTGLRFNADSAEKFWDRIAFYVHRNMRYKLPEKYLNYPCFWDDFFPSMEKSYSAKPLQIVEIRKGLTQKGKTSEALKPAFRWDIETETNNFFTNRLLVHNSMITFYSDGNRYQAHTKMGATDVAMPVLNFVLDRTNYLRLYDAMREEGLTAIFEWCSRQQRIVIDYPTEKLVLTAIRENLSGQYRPYAELVELGKRFGVPVVRALDGSAENIQQFLLEAKDLEGAEGYVIRFEDGHMVKVKGLWYMRIHNTKELFLFEKNVWTMVLKDELDDASPFMEESDKAIVEKFAFELEHRILQKAAELNDFILRAKSKVSDKKAFALEIVPGLSKLEKSLGFKLWDGHDAKLLLRDFLSKNVGTQRAVDEVRDLVGGLKWSDFYLNTTVVED